MLDYQKSELQAVHRLLLNPTATNLASVNEKLENLAFFLAARKQNLMERGMPASDLKTFLAEIDSEMTRVRRLVESACTFFGGLNNIRNAGAYQRNGFLRMASQRPRTLAQL